MPTNKHASIRHLALDKCLRNTGRKYYIEDLVEACNEALRDFTGKDVEVKERTVYYDLSFLESEKGYSANIKKEKDHTDKKHYRYADPNFSIQSHPLSADEYNKLSQALEVLQRFAGLPQFEWIQELSIKVSEARGQKVASKEIIAFDQNPFLKGLEHLSPLYEAISNQQTLKLKYKGARQEKATTQTVFPYYLKQFNSRWFLFAQSKGYDDLTNFALDRIQEIQPSSEAYQNCNIDFVEYFEDLIGVSFPKDAELTLISLRATKRRWPYIESKPLHGSQKKTGESDSHVTFSIEVVPNHELIARLLGFGSDLEVVSPESLRERMKDQLSKTIELYKK